jgi:hypothetical protein
MELGPVEYLVVHFEGGRFNGEILAELGELEKKKIVRVLDMLFIKRDADGAVEWLEYDALAEDERASMGFLDAGMLGLLSEEDALFVAEELPPSTAAGLLVLEDLWAKDLAAAIRKAGGSMVEADRVPMVVVEEAMAYLEEQGA